MAKNILIAALFVLFIGVSIYGLFQRSQISDRDRRVVLAEEERKQARAALELATTNLKTARDSIELLFIIASNANIDSRKAEIRAQQIQKQHETEKASFVIHPNDSVRLRQLAKHFPSVLSR